MDPQRRWFLSLGALIAAPLVPAVAVAKPQPTVLVEFEDGTVTELHAQPGNPTVFEVTEGTER